MFFLSKKIRQLIKLLEGKKLPAELQKVKQAIESHSPALARPQFQKNLRTQLLMKHKTMMAAAGAARSEASAPEDKQPFWKNFEWPSFQFGKKGWSLAISVFLIIAVGGLISYPLIPAPEVQGYSLRENVRRISYNAPLKISFSQPMDRGSVEKAFQVEPSLEGRFEWSNNSLLFHPAKPFEVGQRFLVSLDRSAKSIFQKQLPYEYKEIFEITTSPQVLLFNPGDKSAEVPIDAQLTVHFDRPMIALTTLEQGEAKAIPVKIDPPLKGRVKWLGTDSVRFIPEKLAYATHYTLTIPKGTPSADGGVTDQDFVTSFDTLKPSLLELQSSNEGKNDIYYGPKSKIRLGFNQIMDLEQAKKSIHLLVYTGTDKRILEKGGTDLRKAFTPSREIPFQLEYYSLEDYKIDNNIDREAREKTDEDVETINEIELPKTEDLKKTLLLTPRESLPYGATLLLAIDQELKGIEGNYTLEKSVSRPFQTIGALKVSSDPAPNSDGAKNFKPSSIRFTFPHAMDEEDVKGRFSIEPKEIDQDTKEEKKLTIGSSQGSRFYVSYDFEPSKEYTLRLQKGAKDLFGQSLAEDFVLKVKTTPLDPNFQIVTGSDIDVLDANKPPLFYVRTTNIDHVHVNFRRLSEEEFRTAYANGYMNTLALPQDALTSFDKKVPSTFNKRELTAINFADETGGKIAPGYYYFDVSNPKVLQGDGTRRISRNVFLVSYTGLTVKSSSKKLMVWATSLAQGEPVANMNLTLYRRKDEEGTMVELKGTTDQNGLATFELPGEDNNYYNPYTVIGKKDGDVTMAHTSWSEGIEPWNFNLDYGNENPYFAYLYTDRPIYRPGHTIYFKGLLRKRDGGGFRLPEMKNIRVKVNDSQGEEIYSQLLAINQNGTFSGELALSSKARIGDYFIELFNPDDSYLRRNTYLQSFRVAEYRKPDYELSMQGDKEKYSNGDTAKIKVKAGYFFGAPLPDAAISWTVRSQDYYFFLPADSSSPYASDWFSFSDEGYLCYFGCQGETALVAQGKATLDANGEYTINVPLDIAKKKVSQIYTIEATVADLNNQTVSSRLALPVHRGEYYVGIRNETMISKPGEESKFQVVSLDEKGNPVPNRPVEVSFLKRSWNTVKKKNVDSDFYYENSYEDTLLEKKSVTTNDQGLAQVSFIPREGGLFKIVAESTDARGNKVSAGMTIYSSSNTFINWGRENNDRIELVPDKLEYKPGDTAHILIKSPYQNVNALVSYEREEVLTTKIIKINSNSQIIDVPITEQSLPNIFVSVFLVKGSAHKAGLGDPAPNAIDEREVAAFKVGYTTLQVNTSSRKLAIEVQPDRTNYHPGDTVTLRLKSRDMQGKAVKAELSLSVVDKSVLSLTENVTADLLNEFYRKRLLGVSTGATLTKALARINVQVESGEKGGGGADQAKKRGDFKDTAFWQAVVNTDESGEATISFKLPDNLTTWQVLAIGITPNTLVGSERAEFIVNKDVIVRPVLPRFLIVNDTLTAGAIVHNYLQEAREFEVSLETKGVRLQGKQRQRIRLQPGEEKKLDFPFEVLDETEATFIFKALAVDNQDIGDILEQKLPIHSFSFPEVVATSSALKDNAQHVETVWLPNNIDKKFGSLTLRAAPTLAGSITKGIQYLVTFPYGCAEQLASALLPNLAVKQMIDLPGVGPIAAKIVDVKDLQKKVEIGLQNIYRLQKAEGGWGLWDTSPTNPYLTSYILFTLHQTKIAGYSVDQNVIDRGIGYLRNSVLNQLITTVQLPDGLTSVKVNDRTAINTRAFALYVMAEMGKGDLALSNNLFEHRKDMNLFAKAYFAMNFNLLIKQEKLEGAALDEARKKMETLQKEILLSAKETPRGVQFEDAQLDYQLFDTNTRTTALVLQMLNRIDRGNVLIPKILRYLLLERKDGHFGSTQETAVTLLGLTEYLRASGELDPDFTGTIRVNQQGKLEKRFTAKNIGDVDQIEIPLTELLLDNQDNEIVAIRDGRGTMYFDMNLKYYLPTEQIEARDEGIEVHQEYFALNDLKEEHPLSSVKLGENIRGKITVIVPEDRHYVMVEDYLPAGLEGIDFSLKTSQQDLQNIVDGKGRSCESWKCYPSQYAFNYSEIRDDRVMYFADFLPKGVYEIEYFLRATTPGKFHDLPTLGQETYFPEVFGRSRGQILEVRAK